MSTRSAVRSVRRVEVAQSVLDAAMRLLRVRQAALRSGPGHDADIVPAADPSRWLMHESRGFRELLSARSVTSAHDLRISMPNNRRLLEHGVVMRSYFDVSGTEPACFELLAAERSPDVYLVTPAPVHLKIVDRSRVLVCGPAERQSILELRSRRAVDAALEYWAECSRFATPIESASQVDDRPALTARQQLVLELLADGPTDQAVAHTLGVSRRTVQNEVTRAMTAWGVTSRYALGVAYASRDRS